MSRLGRSFPRRTYAPRTKQVAGPQTLFGQSTVTSTAAITTGGVRKTFSSSVAAFTDAIATGGVRKAFGSSVTTLTDVIVTSGSRKSFGQSVVAETDAITTAGSRKTFGQSVTPLTDNITTAGLIRTTEAATVTLTLSPGGPVEVFTGADAATGAVVFAPSGADTQIAIRQNSFEGGTSGTTISIANSGGASGNPFNLLTIGAGVTLEYNSAAAFVGSLGMRVVQPATGVTSFTGWNKLGPYDGNYWARIYFNVSAVNAQNTMISWRNIGDVAMCHIGINATGKIAVLAGSGAGTSQAPLISTINPAANTWYRLECRVNPTAGEFEWWIYNGHSTTVLDTKAATGVVFPASSLVDGARIGVGTLSTWAANAITGLLDDIALSNVAKIGPSVVAIDYLDSGTATLAFTPSAAEIRERVDSAIVPFAFSLTSADVLVGADAATEVFALTPSGIDVIERTRTDAATGVVSLVPLSSEVFAATDSATGTLVFVPSATDAGQRVEVGDVSIVFATSSNDVLVATDSGTGQLALVPSGIEFSTAAGVDTGIAVFRFTPSASDSLAAVDSATTPVVFSPSSSEGRESVDVAASILALSPGSIEGITTVSTGIAVLNFSPSGTDIGPGLIDEATAFIHFSVSAFTIIEVVDSATLYLYLVPNAIDLVLYNFGIESFKRYHLRHRRRLRARAYKERV